MKKTSIMFISLFLLLPTLLLSAVQFSAVGLRVGQVMPSVTNQGVTSIGFQCNLINDQTEFVFQPFFDYWAASYDKTGEEWTRQLFAAGVSALKPFNLNNSKAVPFVGGGLGLTYSSWQIKFPHASEKSSMKSQELDLALNILGGIEVPIASSFSGMLELKYTLAGMVDYFGFWIGVSYQFNSN